MLAFTYLLIPMMAPSYTNDGSMRNHQIITSSHGPLRDLKKSSWSHDLMCYSIYQSYVTIFWKTDFIVTNTETHFCLDMKATLMHYQEAPST